MKVAILTNFYYPHVGGAETVCQKITEHLVDKGDEVFVFTRRVRGRNHRDFKNYKVIEYHPGSFSSFKNQLNSVSPHKAFLYSDVFDFFKDIITDRRKYKLYLGLCGANWLSQHRTFSSLFNRCSDSFEKIVLHSKLERDYKMLQGTSSEEKIVIIPNGVDIDEFDSNTLKREDLFNENLKNKLWFLNVSNFFPGKFQSILPEIFSSEEVP